MAISTSTTQDEFAIPGPFPESTHCHASGVSWSAILAGSAAIASLSLILLMLGTGLGLSSVSPWAYAGVSATTFGVSSILWLAFTQLTACGLGGYLAGRLRTKWIAVQTDEVYFRDTAHGFLAWAIASLATAALLTSVIGSIVGAGIQAGSVAMNAATGESQAAKSITSPEGYFVDLLFRKDSHATADTQAAVSNGALAGVIQESTHTAFTSEATHIFNHTLPEAALAAEDIRYVGLLVSEHTGLAQPAAQKRVSDVYARLLATYKNAESAAKEAADQGRKATAYAALWLFISLLIGAFVASFAATIGGRQRDMESSVKPTY